MIQERLNSLSSLFTENETAYGLKHDFDKVKNILAETKSRCKI